MPDLELVPRPSLRVVGPGRRERTYRERIDLLEDRVRAAETGARHLARELDVAQRLERGCQRLIDRMETREDADRARLAEAEQREKRLAVALGALQRENELLRARLAAGGPSARLASGERPLGRRRRSWLARLLGRGARG